jgi:hypothetical protein
MLKKRMALVSSLALFLVFAGWPKRADADERKWSLGFNAPINSKYIWRGINVVDDWVFQPAAAVGFGGFSALAWGNMELTGVNDYGAGYGDATFEFTEVDLIANYSFVLDKLNLGVGSIYYQFPNTPFRATTELFFSFGFDVLLSPNMTFYRDIGKVDGTYFNIAVTHSLPNLWELGDSATVSLDMAGTVAFGTPSYNDFYYGFDDFGLADTVLSFALPIVFSRNWVLTPAVSFTTLPNGNARETFSKPDNILFGIGLAYRY